MILITRPSQPPEYAERAALGQAALEAIAAEGGFKAQRRYEFDSSIWLSVRKVLREASSGKCVWCESRPDSMGPADVDHYRPKHRAEGLRKGEIHPDHYWWLAYSWDNLVYCCQACNRAKRTRFPVAGKRLEPGDPCCWIPTVPMTRPSTCGSRTTGRFGRSPSVVTSPLSASPSTVRTSSKGGSRPPG